ncbi:hypothetical protein [Amycolatopsis sp. CA-230715]|uniref:hypothetical protein n=1 Tax=Amycolatopsis sp. CA-230715 TaxID=2745196 RepID=UPI001C01B6A1|nr:hypothetical protein [Amycolatopsis sp. CA-230715]QWF80937.1 hypothetical protein HUW46_04362 [Amycolatopsis sp. CA-230715]
MRHLHVVVEEDAVPSRSFRGDREVFRRVVDRNTDRAPRTAPSPETPAKNRKRWVELALRGITG